MKSNPSIKEQIRAETLLEVYEVVREGKYKLKWWLDQELSRENKRMMIELDKTLALRESQREKLK